MQQKPSVGRAPPRPAEELRALHKPLAGSGRAPGKLCREKKRKSGGRQRREEDRWKRKKEIEGKGTNEIGEEGTDGE